VKTWRTGVLIMSLLKFKVLTVRLKLSLSMPRRHTGQQRYDDMTDYVLIILAGANERAGGVNAGIHAGTSLLAMKNHEVVSKCV
jgi:hypothetical protein